MQTKFLSYFILLFLASCFSPAQAQFAFPPLSAMGKISQRVGNTQIEIEYERPSARNRKIFGGLVPWNEVWRMGAGPCTKIRFNKEVQIGQQRVAAGTYSIFSIPNPDKWVIILNTDTTLYGAYNYDVYKDVARFTVPVTQSARYYETFTIDIDIIPNNARIYVSWEHVSMNFDLITQSDAETKKYIIDQLMTDKVKDPDEYLMAADYYTFKGENFHDALLLVNKSIALGAEGWAYRLKMELLESFMRYPEAIEAAKKGLAWEKIRPLDDEKWRQQGIDEWTENIYRIAAKMEAAKKD